MAGPSESGWISRKVACEGQDDFPHVRTARVAVRNSRPASSRVQNGFDLSLDPRIRTSTSCLRQRSRTSRSRAIRQPRARDHYAATAEAGYSMIFFCGTHCSNRSDSPDVGATCAKSLSAGGNSSSRIRAQTRFATARGITRSPAHEPWGCNAVNHGAEAASPWGRFVR